MFDINIAIYQLEAELNRRNEFVKFIFREIGVAVATSTSTSTPFTIPFYNGDSSLDAIFKSGETLGTGLTY